MLYLKNCLLFKQRNPCKICHWSQHTELLHHHSASPFWPSQFSKCYQWKCRSHLAAFPFLSLPTISPSPSSQWVSQTFTSPASKMLRETFLHLLNNVNKNHNSQTTSHLTEVHIVKSFVTSFCFGMTQPAGLLLQLQLFKCAVVSFLIAHI